MQRYNLPFSEPELSKC